MTDINNYHSLYRLSKTYGYCSSETFARHLAALKESKKVMIKELHVGKRRLLNVVDVERVMASL